MANTDSSYSAGVFVGHGEHLSFQAVLQLCLLTLESRTSCCTVPLHKHGTDCHVVLGTALSSARKRAGPKPLPHALSSHAHVHTTRCTPSLPTPYVAANCRN